MLQAANDAPDPLAFPTQSVIPVLRQFCHVKTGSARDLRRTFVAITSFWELRNLAMPIFRQDGNHRFPSLRNYAIPQSIFT
jgi:hypothetical protein